MLTRSPNRTVESLKKQLANKKDANVRERALNAIQAIAEHADTSPSVEPYLVVLLPSVLSAVGDKMVPVKNAAQAAALAIIKAVSANGVKAVLPPIINSILTLPNRLLIKLDASNDYFKTQLFPIGVIRITAEKATGFAEDKKGAAQKLFSKLTRASPDTYVNISVGAEDAW